VDGRDEGPRAGGLADLVSHSIHALSDISHSDGSDRPEVRCDTEKANRAPARATCSENGAGIAGRTDQSYLFGYLLDLPSLVLLSERYDVLRLLRKALSRRR
jgi:hypothetical protein